MDWQRIQILEKSFDYFMGMPPILEERQKTIVQVRKLVEFNISTILRVCL